MHGCEVVVEGEELILLPEGAIYWQEQDALLVADLHIGKGAAFRAGSVPIPTGSSSDTLENLSRLLTRTQACRLFILGDFWHAKQGRTDGIHELILDWRREHRDLEIVMVEGNHDRRAGALPVEMNVQELPDYEVGPFVLRHHPEEDGRGYVLCGHVHPAVRLIGQGRQVEKLPAFIIGPRVGILPAFGEFTGDATVFPSSEDRVYVMAGEEVVPVGVTAAGSLR